MIDGLLQRNSKAFSYSKATIRDVRSLRRWVEGTGCLARDETTFLDHQEDLVNIVGPFDHAAVQVEPLVEESLVYLASLFHVVSLSAITLPSGFLNVQVFRTDVEYCYSTCHGESHAMIEFSFFQVHTYALLRK